LLDARQLFLLSHCCILRVLHMLRATIGAEPRTATLAPAPPAGTIGHSAGNDNSPRHGRHSSPETSSRIEVPNGAFDKAAPKRAAIPVADEAEEAVPVWRRKSA
jgi:hypothetical protein